MSQTPTIDRDEIRREMGLFTIAEVSNVTGLDELRIARAITVTKELSFNQSPNGELLVTKADLAAILAGRPLSQGPKVYGDAGWFADAGPQRAQLGMKLQDEPHAYGDYGPQMLVTEARAEMRFQVHKLAEQRPLHSDSACHAKVLYKMGPDRFAAVLQTVRERLNRMSIRYYGIDKPMATFSDARAVEVIKGLLKKHGSLDVSKLGEQTVPSIAATATYTRDVEAALKEAF